MKFKLLKENSQTLYHGYHGSKQAFKEFNYNFIGSHALEHGFGLYFTDNENIAQSYGNYIIEADLLIRKPFSDDKITITKEQVKEYIKKYIDSTGDNYLSLYPYNANDIGYELALDLVMNDLFSYNQSDNDIISEILPYIKNK